jgi:hypothetical protein
MYAEADRAQVRDRAKVHIFAKTFFSGSPVVLGPDSGSENIILTGWIDGQSMQINPELNTIKFTIHGPQWWLDKVASWPAGIRGHLNVDPVNWNEYKYLTYDAFLWHILRWRCTAMEIMDVFPSNINTRMVGADAPWGTIWSQFSQVADSVLLIHPCVNRLGQLYNERDVNTLNADIRSTLPRIMTLTKDDWQGDLEIERRIVPDIGFMDTTGMFWNGTNAGGFRAGSWGTAVGRFGRMERRTELYVNEYGGQEETNLNAGILLGKANNPYPRITAALGCFNPFFDIAPNQLAHVNVAPEDTPLNATFSTDMVIRTVSYEWDRKFGTLYTSISGDGLSEIEHGFVLPFYTGPQWDIPPAIPNNPWTPGNRTIRPPTQTPCTAATAAGNGPFPLSGAGTIQDVGGVTSFTQYYHGQLRNSGATYRTKLAIESTFYSGSPGAWVFAASGSANAMTVQALDMSGTPVTTAYMDPYTGGPIGTRIYAFMPPNSTEISGFTYTAEPSSKAVINKVNLLNICRYFDPPRSFSGSTVFNYIVDSQGFVGDPTYTRWVSGYLEWYRPPGYSQIPPYIYWRFNPPTPWVVSGSAHIHIHFTYTGTIDVVYYVNTAESGTYVLLNHSYSGDPDNTAVDATYDISSLSGKHITEIGANAVSPSYAGVSPNMRLSNWTISGAA